jgi:rare lipoprotein A
MQLLLGLLGTGAFAPSEAWAAPTEVGFASFYHDYFHGRVTASGEPFDNTALTAAHRTLPFGTRVRVTNLANGLTTDLRINDRGPYNYTRCIDLSKAAAQTLDFVAQGVARVKVEVLPERPPLTEVMTSLRTSAPEVTPPADAPKVTAPGVLHYFKAPGAYLPNGQPADPRAEGPFTVQLVARHAEDEALAAVRDMEAKGFVNLYVHVCYDADLKPVFRIVTGSFIEANEAEQYRTVALQQVADAFVREHP